MKTVLFTSLFISFGAFAQSIDLLKFKSLIEERKSSLEVIRPGMSSKTYTQMRELQCETTRTVVETVLKIEGQKMIVLSEEKTTYHPDCGDTEPFSERIMYYKDIPTVAAFNLELDRDASSISSIKKKDDLVVMNMKFTSVDEEGVEVVETSEITYDLSGPLFSIVSSTDSQNIWSSTSLENDRDLAVIDLSNILFCDNNDEDLSDCAEGDFSDILF